MILIITTILILIGALLMFPAALGIVRLPDIYMRMSAATKAATLGTGFLLLAVAVFFEDPGITTRALAVIVFIFLTAPVAAHRIGRAAYFTGVPYWIKTNIDELKGCYDRDTHTLHSQPTAASDEEPLEAEYER